MAKTRKASKTKKPVSQEAVNLELDPDAWSKFEKLVKNAAKMGHKPHLPATKAEHAAAKRVDKTVIKRMRKKH